MIKICIALCLYFISIVGHTDELPPASCKKWAVLGDKITIKASKKPVLALLQNTTASDLWFTEPSGLSTRLEPGHWTAMMLDQKKLVLSCIESRPGHEQQASCSGLAAVYKWRGVKFPDNLKVVVAEENLPLNILISRLRDRGFYLP